MSFSEILKSIFIPPMGSIWCVPNRIWHNGFAPNKDQNALHPAMVGKVKKDKISVLLIPGSSKNYNKGICVFRTKLIPAIESFFLIRLSMTMDIESLSMLKRGWGNVESLSEEQIMKFRETYNECIKSRPYLKYR